MVIEVPKPRERLIYVVDGFGMVDRLVMLDRYNAPHLFQPSKTTGQLVIILRHLLSTLDDGVQLHNQLIIQVVQGHEVAFQVIELSQFLCHLLILLDLVTLLLWGLLCCKHSEDV